MGRLATRTAGGTRLEPKEKVKIATLIKEGEIDEDEVVYEVTPKGIQKLDKQHEVKPGKEYGVVPSNDVGAWQ